MKEYYNVSQLRVCRYLYSLGFEKESWFDKNGKEHWRFEKTDDLMIAMYVYKKMRDNNKVKN